MYFKCRKVEQERLLTALVTGFTDKIFQNFETSLNNVFDFDIWICLVNFYT